MFGASLSLLAHAFGERYELPIPLVLFLLGGASIVFLSFLLVLPQKVAKQKLLKANEDEVDSRLSWPSTIAGFIVLGLSIACGLFGTQEVAENIVPTLFWLIVWIAVPLSCGIIGNWTQQFNPFASIGKLADSPKARRALLGSTKVLTWPAWLGWWPAALLFFIMAAGELIYNETATKPAVIAAVLLLYGMVCAFAGLVYGKQWLRRGEVFSVLFSTWGRLGYFRFGAPGPRGFAGGLKVPFDDNASRTVFTLLLLISVSFDGLLSTPAWERFANQLPQKMAIGSIDYQLLATGVFIALAVAIWLLFTAFARSVKQAGGYKTGSNSVLAGLLPSLVPISFGYLLAHNLQYLLVNGQLLFPLIGNPVGSENWPIHMGYPFNDEFDPNVQLLPGAFFWYLAVLVIIVVHIIAVVLAHRHLGSATKNTSQARRSEYPWIFAMVLYTILSLWLLAQPLVKEKTEELETGYHPVTVQVSALPTAARY